MEFTMFVICLKLPFFFRHGKQHHLEHLAFIKKKKRNLICSESSCRRLNASWIFRGL